MRVSTPRWSIQLAPGWHAHPGPDRVTLSSHDPMASVRLTTFDPPETGMTARRWVEMAPSIHPLRARPLERVRCGDFTGYRSALVVSPKYTDGWLPKDSPDDHFLRFWMLESDGIPLDVGHSCPLSVSGRNDTVVDGMLATLRVGEPSPFRRLKRFLLHDLQRA